METLTLEEQRLLSAELSNGESILWSGKPNPRVIFHASDWFQIPFSLVWAGFTTFWELSACGFGFAGSKSASFFMMIWGIPFVLIGQYLVWGRFIFIAWRKGRVLYALTNERLIVMVRSLGAKTTSMYLQRVPGIQKEIRSDGIGTLKFGIVSPVLTGRSRKQMDTLYLNADVPVFVDIDHAADVADQVAQAMKRTLNDPAIGQ